MARKSTRFGWLPVMIKPPIKAPSPPSCTRRRVEMLPRSEAAACVTVTICPATVSAAVR